jgi:hypothetical protein
VIVRETRRGGRLKQSCIWSLFRPRTRTEEEEEEEEEEGWREEGVVVKEEE